MLTRQEITWKRIARFSLGNVLPEYDKLYWWLGKDGLFLYNHAAELHKAKEFEKSIAVFEQCTRYYNDMDVQMLLASNYKELGKYAEAEKHLKTAAAMCPARFMPLYELVKLYQVTDRRDEALLFAKKIIDKDVKIQSFTVTAIKNEMRQFIETTETYSEELYTQKQK
jgi:tetratricopeptide (TPR) repeat protein